MNQWDYQRHALANAGDQIILGVVGESFVLIQSILKQNRSNSRWLSIVICYCNLVRKELSLRTYQASAFSCFLRFCRIQKWLKEWKILRLKNDQWGGILSTISPMKNDHLFIALLFSSFLCFTYLLTVL